MALILFAALLGASGGTALAVVGGKAVSITAVPWTAVIWEKSPYPGQPRYAACTGVIIGPRDVLTAAHCVVAGTSARLLPKSSFRVEAGTSNFEHRSASDHPQASAVTAIRVMRGYIPASKLSFRNETQFTAHDVAILRLSRPFDLNGKDTRAASLPAANTPKPSATSKLVIAGFGNEKPTDTTYAANGTLNEVLQSRVLKRCITAQVLCMYARTTTCLGDSGAGVIEPGRDPTVVGLLSLTLNACRPGSDLVAYLAAPAILRFIRSNS